MERDLDFTPVIQCIWVNGTPAYEARFAEGVRHAFSAADPQEGSNSIPIKTAQRTGSWNWGARLYPDVGYREESILQAPLSPHPPTADGSFPDLETEMEERGLQPKRRTTSVQSGHVVARVGTAASSG